MGTGRDNMVFKACATEMQAPSMYRRVNLYNYWFDSDDHRSYTNRELFLCCYLDAFGKYFLSILSYKFKEVTRQQDKT